jgi:hypothetical protein
MDALAGVLPPGMVATRIFFVVLVVLLVEEGSKDVPLI